LVQRSRKKNPVKSIGALLREQMLSELRKGEPTSVDLNAAMIARDEPKTFRLPKPPTFVLRAEQAAPATAKPNPFQNYTAIRLRVWSFRSPERFQAPDGGDEGVA
jgi:hypothetical protein